MTHQQSASYKTLVCMIHTDQLDLKWDHMPIKYK